MDDKTSHELQAMADQLIEAGPPEPPHDLPTQLRLIRHDLQRQGVDPELVQAALENIETESERARRLVEARGPGPKTAQYLARRGFAEEALEAALGGDVANDP